MKIDAEVQGLMGAASELGLFQMHQLPIAGARQVYAKVGQELGGAQEDMAAVENHTAHGPGGAIPLRLYRPFGAEAVPSALVYFHGGGWTVGSIDTHDKVCRRIAARSNCAVVSVDYRLAPEHPMPAQAEDALGALDWIASNGAQLRIDESRLAVGGDSAGGNLSAVCALAWRDRPVPLRGQVLLYPSLDLRPSEKYPSRMRNAGIPPLTHDVLSWFLANCLPDPQRDPEGLATITADWRVSPAATPDLTGSISTLLLLADADPLLDEGRRFADRLEAAGVDVTRRTFPGMIHGFMEMAGVLRAADEGFDHVALFLRQRLGRLDLVP